MNTYSRFRTDRLARLLRTSLFAFFAIAVVVADGCGNGTNSISGGTNGSGGSGGSALMNIAVKDALPTGVTVVSSRVTITGMTLNSSANSPVTLVSSSNPVTVDVARLQADSTFIASANVPAGSYSNLSVSVANFSATVLNTSGVSATFGGVACANDTACQISSGAAASVTLSTSPFPLTVTSGVPVVVTLDFNLGTILDSTLTPNFSSGVTAAATTLSLNNTAVVPVGNIFAQVTAIDISHANFTIANSQGSFTINFDGNTSFRDFPSGCPGQNASCLATKQAVVVNAKFKNDGTFLASTVTFEDTFVTEPLVEGEIVHVDSPTQLHLVVFEDISPVSSLAPGTVATVTITPSTTFSVDDDGTNNSAFQFVAAANLIAGQVVQVKALSSSSGTSLTADRIRLRDTELTVKVMTTGSPNFTVNTLPPVFTSAAINQFQVQTFGGTEFAGTMTSSSQLTGSQSVSLRGQLFRTGSNSVVLTASLVAGN